MLTPGTGAYEVTVPVVCPKYDWWDCDYRERCLAAAKITHVTDASLPQEGYGLKVAQDGIEISSSDEAGRFHALQTLRQMSELVSTNRLSVPCCTIRDWPVFRWRGLQLDVVRHFFSKTDIKRLMDTMAEYKLNVFHWHLTDDQGWRLDLKSHPELVEYGAVRPCSVRYGTHARWLPPAKNREQEFDADRYGPFFYTREDVQEIVDYARKLHIAVVPEIEMPGHVRAFLAAHPECSCRGSELPRIPCCGWVIEDDVLCAGNDESIRIFEEIFDEVCGMFPDAPYIHIGGDECPRRRWKDCPKCQARIREIGAKDESGLQAWITARLVRHLEAKGRRVIGWDELLAGDVPNTTVGMSWRISAKGGSGTTFVSAAEAAARGHDIVLTPMAYCYFDVHQGIESDPNPYLAPWMDPVTLEKVYSFDPLSGIAESDRGHVLGAQANLWSEATHNITQLEWKAWPRACALSEVLWCGDLKPGFDDFRRRMETRRRDLLSRQVNCAPVRIEK